MFHNGNGLDFNIGKSKLKFSSKLLIATTIHSGMLLKFGTAVYLYLGRKTWKQLATTKMTQTIANYISMNCHASLLGLAFLKPGIFQA